MGAARAWDGHHGTFSSTFNRRRKSRMPVDALLAFLANSEGGGQSHHIACREDFS